MPWLQWHSKLSRNEKRFKLAHPKTFFMRQRKSLYKPQGVFGTNLMDIVSLLFLFKVISHCCHIGI